LVKFVVAGGRVRCHVGVNPLLGGESTAMRNRKKAAISANARARARSANRLTAPGAAATAGG
jgi:hypothetical protein